MLKIIFWLCMLILSLLTGFHSLQGQGEIGKLENSPFALFGEYTAREKNLAIAHNMQNLPIIEITTSCIEKEKGIGALTELENEVKQLRIIYNEETDLKDQILKWESKEYDCYKKTKEFEQQLKKLDREQNNMIKKSEQNKEKNENLKIEYELEKEKLDKRKLELREIHGANQIGPDELREELISIFKKHDEFDLKIDKLHEEFAALDFQEDRNTEEYESKKIEINQKLYNQDDEEAEHVHFIEDLQEEKNQLARTRKEKQIQIWQSIKSNFDYLKNLPALHENKNKKRKLKFQMTKFNAQEKRFYAQQKVDKKDDKKDIKKIEVLEEHIQFLKEF